MLSAAHTTTKMPTSSPFLKDAFHRLDNILTRISKKKHFALAFSGGMDSRFLAHAALLLGYTPILLHISGPHVDPQETKDAQDWARERDLELHHIEMDPLQSPEVASGHPMRCYFCKKSLFLRLKEETELSLCDGTNLSDLGAYRPGRQALKELNVISPLAEAALSKTNIHDLAARTDLDRPFQAPRPCLLTRFPYGMPVNHKLLHAIGKGERAVRNIFAQAGYPCPDFRLRLLDEKHAVLHLAAVETEGIPPEVYASLASAVLTESPTLPALSIQHADILSGFFDRHPLEEPPAKGQMISQDNLRKG